MKVISTNIGEPKTFIRKGEKVVTGIFKFPVNEPVFLGKEDVEKDHVIDRKYHGGVDKACYLYSADHYTYWQNIYPHLELPFGMFGENITVEGFFETEVNVGDIFQLGEAVVQATQPRQPCFKMEFRFNDKNIIRNFINSGFSGVYVRVLSPGKVKTGDKIKLVEKANSLSIQKIFDLLYSDEINKNELEIAVNEPNLADSCRRDLMKKWNF